MGIIELLGVAGSVSLLSGWRLYLTIFATGLAMYSGWIDLPENLKVLDALGNPWVIGISAVGATAEFFADKVAWLDSVWDTLHSIIRPVGGALLALAVVDASDPVWQVITFLLGGGAAFMSHATKASARTAVNVSPEPVSNMVVSTGEDIATGGLLFLALANPEIAILVALALGALTVYLFFLARRIWKKVRGIFPEGRFDPEPPENTGQG